MGGDANGAKLRPASYTPNLLNRYSNRTVPGANDILGIAHPSATVTVNGNASYRKGDYWDAEDRLVQMESFATAPSGSRRKLEFAYDYMGRRISKKVSKWNGSSYGTPEERKFLYDGWNLLCELNGSDVFLRGYAWGLDLSGSFDGAGGVGGLVLVHDKDLGSHFPMHDGNGNVTGYVKVPDGTESARNEDGPVGESIRRTAGSADSVVLSPIGFSSKYTDAETARLRSATEQPYLHSYTTLRRIA